MTKIIVLDKRQCNGYFELGYKFFLTVPQAQKDMATVVSVTDKLIDAETKAEIEAGNIVERGGSMAFGDGTSAIDIKKKLEALYQDAQTKLDADSKAEYFKMAWDGAVWTGGK